MSKTQEFVYVVVAVAVVVVVAAAAACNSLSLMALLFRYTRQAQLMLLLLVSGPSVRFTKHTEKYLSLLCTASLSLLPYSFAMHTKHVNMFFVIVVDVADVVGARSSLALWVWLFRCIPTRHTQQSSLLFSSATVYVPSGLIVTIVGVVFRLHTPNTGICCSCYLFV